MSQYQQFIFEDYQFDTDTKVLTLRYAIDDAFTFTETYRFMFDFSDNYALEAVLRACELLFFIAGVSYYKTYLPPEIVVHKGQIDDSLKNFFDTTYQRGLGEFFYVNSLDPKTPINFPVTAKGIEPVTSPGAEGFLVGLGGGKDSLVTAEILRTQPRTATWSLNHRTQLEPLVSRVGLPHFYVERVWDKQLLQLNEQGAYNGHVPISAIFASVGTIVSLLTGYTHNVVSNESSASEPTLTYQNVAINHQYSKSLEFEMAFQEQVNRLLLGTTYYSFLRPLSEVHIAEVFAKTGFDTYHGVFSSCNRAFTHDSPGLFWDGTCSKCAFVFLALTPFVAREKLVELFGGKNLLLDPSLEPTYRQLLGIEGDKPLECVGEVKECRAAMRLAQNQYPELASTYQFELPTDYDYRSLSTHSMPEEVFNLLRAAL